MKTITDHDLLKIINKWKNNLKRDIGIGAAFAAGYRACEQKLKQPQVSNSLLADFPENRPLYKDSGSWQMRTDDMENVIIQQEYMETDESFINRCKASNDCSRWQ